MKILFISRRFYPDVIGGGQISPFYLARTLVKLKHQVYVLTFTNKKDYNENLKGIKICRKHIKQLKHLPRFSNMDYMYWQIAKQSVKFIKEIKPDVIHLLNFEAIPYTSFILKKKFPKVPIFATVNGPCFGCFTGAALDYKEKTCLKCNAFKRILCCWDKWGKARGSLFYLYSLWYMRLLRFSYKYIDKFFSVSKAMIPLLENMGIPRNKIKVVHNPINLNKKNKTNLKKKLGIENKKVILYAGRLSKEKGIHYIIKAIPYLKNVVFLIAGRKKGYYRQLNRLVEQLKIRNKVKFIGFIKPEKLKEFYSITDLVILPCIIYESLSRMLLEANSYGIPVIASNIGGNPEIVEDKKNGILLRTFKTKELVKAINYILKDPNTYKRMSQSCKEKIKKKFNLKSISQQILSEYKKCISLKD